MEPSNPKSTLTQQMGLDSTAQARMKAFVTFTEQDASALRQLLPLVTQHANDIVNRFYVNLEQQPELLDVVRNAGSNIDRLKAAQRRYLIEMFEGQYGDTYFEGRLKIGVVHNRIGLTPRWYLGSYSVYISALTPLITRLYWYNFAKRDAALLAMNKIISIDSQLAIETYIKKSADAEFADYRGQIEAISRSQAVVEFNLDGTIRDANENFLSAVGYRLEEVRGKHHRMFVDPVFANSVEYRAFWEKLGRGEYDAGEYRRIHKQGSDVWLRATYNPIRDGEGKVFKIVKYANDVTQQKLQALAYQERVKRFGVLIEEIAHGDLRQRVQIGGGGELDQLGGNLNVMTESLGAMAREIGDAANALASTVSELQGAVNAQSAGATEQAAAVSETTATLEEIKATSSQTLLKSQQLGEAAERTKIEGEQGLQTVELAVRGMEAIRERVENIAQTILALSEQTQQIGEITSVVTNLAQQSKMLALNASIEAAKAGDAGKGFAVMATEDGSKGVDAGVLLVQRTGEVMGKLNQIIRETTLASQQIVAAVRQEVTGIDQVTSAMSEINKVTTQFVGGTQQTMVASTKLNDVARKLATSVSVYKI